MGDQQLNTLFVKEIEKYPILYNFTLPGYSKKDDTEKAWQEVGKIVNMSVAECKNRWKNLRAVFTRHMKPYKNGSGGKAKKAYYLLEAMQFTLPYIKSLGMPSGNLLHQPKQEKIELFKHADESSILQSSSSPKEQQTPSKPRQWEEPLSDISKRKRSLNSDYSHAKKTKTNQDQKIKGLKMFLFSMLPDLLSMNDDEVRHFKRKALDVIDEILSTRTTIYPEIAFSSRSTTPSSVSEMSIADETL